MLGSQHAQNSDLMRAPGEMSAFPGSQRSTSDESPRDDQHVTFAGPKEEKEALQTTKTEGNLAGKNGSKARRRTSLLKVPQSLQWIPANMTWSKWKPVIRSAVSAWLSLVLLVIQPVEVQMGQASFLILIAAFLSPPSDPFIAVFEREFWILFMATLAWAWSSLGIKLANLTRTEFVPNAPTTAIFNGDYIEAAPTVIMAVFLFLGSAFFLYLKVRLGPGPYIFATVFGCICIDINLATAHMFPYPYYLLGKAILIPLTLHTGMSLLTSFVLFPSTISAQYATRLSGILSPLQTTLSAHSTLLTSPPDQLSKAFASSPAKTAPGQAEAGLLALRASARLLARDTTLAWASPQELEGLHDAARRLAVRANGLGAFFTLIDPLREPFPAPPRTPATPAAGTPGTPKARSRVQSERTSREASVDAARLPPGSGIGRRGREGTMGTDSTASPNVTLAPSPTMSRLDGTWRRRKPLSLITSQEQVHTRGHDSPLARLLHLNTPRSHHPGHHHSLHTPALHAALLRLAHPSLPHVSEPVPVGAFESTRYATLACRHGVYVSPADSERYTAQAIVLLRESAGGLIEESVKGLGEAMGWLGRARSGRLSALFGRERKMQNMEGLKRVSKELETALREFKVEKRLAILAPYRSTFDPLWRKDHPEEGNIDVPPHRYLFHSFYYQYHLCRFACNLLDLLKCMEAIDNARDRPMWFIPHGLGDRLLKRTNVADDDEHADDDDPDAIPGMDREWDMDLGVAGGRDPDALPPRNAFEHVMHFFYTTVGALTRGNVLFALKAGLLTILVCLPLYIRSSAGFAYRNRAVWAVIMSQLTVARFRGDTTFGLATRIGSTFFGGLVGLIVWYISTGEGTGSRYGLAATCAVCFPLFFFGRLYYPGPPMTNIVFFVTIALVVGYSWQDSHVPSAGSQGWGWSVAWKRFVLVSIGVFAAFLFSFLPPSTTLRRYQRTALSTTAGELGALYCSIISFASHSAHSERHTDEERQRHTQEIVRSLIAVRAKLKKSLVLKANIIYEFSLRGRWPSAHYHKVLDMQLQIAYLLSHLMSTIEQLEPQWSQAFLRRTHFMDTDFQGGVLAVFSMIATSLRTGHPLPQITPCPLLEKFMENHHGLNVPMGQEDEDAYGLPRTVTMDILEDMQYMTFCVAVTTAYNIVTRLDRLMVAVKELVGEQYHIDGLGLVMCSEGALSSRTTSLDVRPGQDA